eukprot:m.165345 g.165345  ORF g.165345 m.165345 type:complete len:461 (+) comp12551_c0_seq1:40-1422(+)
MGKKVLILGAGLVAGPGIKYLAETGHEVTVASRTVARAEKLIKGLPNCTAVAVEVGNPEHNAKLEELVGATDIVVSLVPWTMHTPVAELAVKKNKHFASTSYISKDMEGMDGAFKANGKICFNECGVDPGLDHMSAAVVFDDVKSKGGKIKSFLSYCGGLPCPDDNNNPFGYKFSWSPRGVLLAAVREAFYIEDGEEKKMDATPGNGIYDKFILDSTVPNVGPPLEKATWPEAFESHPNGDSIKFKPIYDLPDCDTLIRGTYRSVGWCDTMRSIKQLGLLDQEPCAATAAGTTYAKLLAADLGCEPAGVKAAVATKLGIAEDDAIIGRLEWLGLFSDKDATAPTKIDALCKLFQENPKFYYADGERDMIAMHHTFKIENADGSKETRTSTLVDYGIKGGDTSMARTVTLPVAIAIKKILSGEISNTGVCRPITADLYVPILKEMEDSFGIKFTEKTTPGW